MPETARDYRSTLNLPKTDFPMRAELPKREPDRVAWWAEQGTYRKRLAANTAGSPFILHDGPPYANGELHMGHFLNRVLKDALVKINLLDGRYADFIPGWDMHGLPIERETLLHLGLRSHHEIDPLELREQCKQRALSWLDRQRASMLRMGCFGHFDDPYMTIVPAYEAAIVETLADLAEAGQTYKGLRPTQWCVHDETALADAEIEYKDQTSHQIYVRFPATPEQRAAILERAGADVPGGERLSVLCWTTTPWSMPGVVGVAFNADAEYGIYRVEREGHESELLVLAIARAADVFGVVHGARATLLAELPGSALVGATLRHSFMDRDVLLVDAPYVELDTGTGAVTTAPGSGPDDFETGVRFGLPTLVPIDARGVFDEGAGPYAGMQVFEANPHIVEGLRAGGMLWYSASYEHSYPHCWRCKNPVIYRATAQWFLAMDANGLRRTIEDQLPGVSWLPAWGETRMTQIIDNHPEWCLSRQRVWGTPIPAVVCEDCGESTLDPAIARNAAARFRQDGAGVWWTEPVGAFVPAGWTCPKCGGSAVRKESNIVDIWFESGVSWRAVINDRVGTFPADAFLEGSDQYRGWFRSNLITAVATKGAPPYRQVISTGWVVDQDGRAMHKSAGNYIGADDAMRKYGADVLRLWVASTEFTGDIRLGASTLENVANVYKNLRFRLRFLLGLVAGLTPAAMVPRTEMEPLDRLALASLDAFSREVVEHYRAFRLHDAYVAIQRFDKEDLSGFYADVLKDRLYSSAPDAKRRRSAQSALFEIFRTMSVLLAPILSFTAEEAWQHLQPELRGEAESVFDVAFPRAEEVDDADRALWQTLKTMRARVAASEGMRDFQLDASVRVAPELHDRLVALGDNLREALVVSSLRALDAGRAEDDGAPSVTLVPAAGEKCQRCWKYLPLGGDPEHPTLCAPCAEIVRELETQGAAK
jgi:isoleucyl-tRNA synthetase